MTNKQHFSDMASIEAREKSFKKWPFNKGSCTAKEMAKSGFFMTSAKYLSVQCYYCFKEMEGWEPTDDPLEEHKKHAPYCTYASRFQKSPEFLTLQQVLSLELHRTIRRMDLECEQKIQDFNDQVDDIVAPIQRSSSLNKKKRPGRKN